MNATCLGFEPVFHRASVLTSWPRLSSQTVSTRPRPTTTLLRRPLYPGRRIVTATRAPRTTAVYGAPPRCLAPVASTTSTAAPAGIVRTTSRRGRPRQVPGVPGADELDRLGLVVAVGVWVEAPPGVPAPEPQAARASTVITVQAARVPATATRPS